MSQLAESDRGSVYNVIRKFELIYHVLEKDIKLLAEPHFTRLFNTQLLAEDLAFFNTDIWGLGLEIDRLLRHVEVEVCEKEDEDNVTPPQQCLFKLAPGASAVFHLRIEFIVGKGEQSYDEEYTMFLLSERVSELFPLMRQLIEAGYELYRALDGYEDFRITPATLDREIWKDTLMEHCEGRDCG